MIRALALMLAALLVSGCLEEKPGPPPVAQEISSAAVGVMCGMSLLEHPGPKAQMFVAGQTAPVWFSSVRDMFAYTLLPEGPKAIRAIYVNDMGAARNWDQPEPGTWIEARQAVFVIGSHRRGGMGEDEAVPFATESQARAFIAGNGGRIVRFADMPGDYILPHPAAEPAGGATRG